MAGNFPAGRWTRVFRPAQTALLLIYYMHIIKEVCLLVNKHIIFSTHGIVYLEVKKEQNDCKQKISE